jgi:hypothetical protein
MKRATWILAALMGMWGAPTQAQSMTYLSGQVARLYPSSTGPLYFRLKADTCNTGTAYYVIPTTEPNLKSWYALLLAAAEAGAEVKVALPVTTACGTATNKEVAFVFRDY